MTRRPGAADDLLTPAAVAALLYVDPSPSHSGPRPARSTPSSPQVVIEQFLVGRYVLRPAALRVTSGHGPLRPAIRLGTLLPVGSYPDAVLPSAAKDTAAAVVAEAVATALKAEAEAAAEAATTIRRSRVVAARESGGDGGAGAEVSRVRAAAAARLVAHDAARTAEAMQSRAETAAAQVARRGGAGGSHRSGGRRLAHRAGGSAGRPPGRGHGHVHRQAMARDTLAAVSSATGAAALAAADVAATVAAVEVEVEGEGRRRRQGPRGPGRAYRARGSPSDARAGERGRDRGTTSGGRGPALSRP